MNGVYYYHCQCGTSGTNCSPMDASDTTYYTCPQPCPRGLCFAVGGGGGYGAGACEGCSVPGVVDAPPYTYYAGNSVKSEGIHDYIPWNAAWDPATAANGNVAASPGTLVQYTDLDSPHGALNYQRRALLFILVLTLPTGDDVTLRVGQEVNPGDMHPIDPQRPTKVANSKSFHHHAISFKGDTYNIVTRDEA